VTDYAEPIRRGDLSALKPGADIRLSTGQVVTVETVTVSAHIRHRHGAATLTAEDYGEWAIFEQPTTSAPAEPDNDGLAEQLVDAIGEALGVDTDFLRPDDPNKAHALQAALEVLSKRAAE